MRRLLSLLQRQNDRAGALLAYETFAGRLEDEYGATPTPDTTFLIERIRTAAPSDAAVLPAAPAPDLVGTTPSQRSGLAEARLRHAEGAAHPPTAAPAALTHARPRRPQWLASAAVVALIALVAAALGIARLASGSNAAPSLLAVGWVENEVGESAAETVRVLRGLLATDLARIESLPVVSQSRLLEILGQRGAAETALAVTEAARRAGAAELLEGTLYHRGENLRLELRRVDLERGVVRGVYTAEDTDPYSLVSQLTAQVARSLALPPPSTPLAGTGTGSLTARILYEQGLRMLYRDDFRGALALFQAALTEDSTFAMANYYAARTTLDDDSARILMERADRLTEHAPTRDRLLIRIGRFTDQYAVRLAVAESLVAHFPGEPDGALELAQVRYLAGDFLGAVPLARRVLAMDSSAFDGGTGFCRTCNAHSLLIDAYVSADSTPAAERAAREWTRRRPTSAPAWLRLYWVLVLQRRQKEALAALNQAVSMPLWLEPVGRPVTAERANAALYMDDLAEAERILRTRLSEDERDLTALWWLVITLRMQGRLAEADTVSQRALRLAARDDEAWIWHAAQVRFERGDFRGAAAAFHSSAHAFEPRLREWPGALARVQSWAHTHTATAWAAGGDTARLASLADSIEAVAHLSSYGRDWRLPRYVRGLLWEARGEPGRAAAEFREAIYSSTTGYTRINLELARALLALRRPHDAVAVLQPAFRGPFDSSNLYVTRTELHELLGRAFEDAGQRDSAAAHYRVVAHAWSAGDPPIRARADNARTRLRALGR